MDASLLLFLLVFFAPPPQVSVSFSLVVAPPPVKAVRKKRLLEMTSAYSGEPGDGRKGVELLKIPLRARLSDGEEVEIGPFLPSEVPAGRSLMNEVIVEGRAWPFEEEFHDEESYRAYFLSHAAFVVRSLDGGDVAGTFYVKPNFPGRCGHVCNGGFITAEPWRRRGVGRLMAKCFLRFAKDLGYASSYFNLVFQSNEASVHLWDSLGFRKVAEIPNCARLRGLDTLDTALGYYYDLTALPDDYDPCCGPS
mmetsp:Transcript_35039/g.112165  ORF Transcript_35039/g.112165 Transcript_35039/m.112165 type:complete len:251 (-) Transcript_35039:82-834(-)